MPIIRALPMQLHLGDPSLSRHSAMKMGAAVAAATAATSSSLDMEEQRITVMLTILFVSLFAVSFPTLSKQVRFLRIPGILFFIGKHFGTGVILATAFIHLLDDAFRSLADQKVEERYGAMGKWTGSIILASLLAIFLVEYMSTSFVEHLNERSSAPSTPIASQAPSRPLSPAPKLTCAHPDGPISETTPLLTVGPPGPTAMLPSAHATPRLPAPGPLRAQTYHALPPPAPHSHALHTHQVQLPLLPGLSMEVLTNSPRVCRMALAHEQTPIQILGKTGEQLEREHYEQERAQSQYEREQRHIEETKAEQKPRVGRRRQIVGLLVLQMGIMIHSFVIGLTLSVTSGSDFTSLTTAIIFHQLFEGLSLGIRIASIPPKLKTSSDSKKLDVEEVQERLEEEVDPEYRTESAERVGAPPRHILALSPHATHHHHHVSGKHKSTCRTPSSLLSSPAKRARWSPWKWRWKDVKEIKWLNPTLTILFGVTTPIGMASGMLLWGGPDKKHSANDASMLLTQGIMSAVSAGLLIYAATVEMIAGDFVFGDVEGHHHHHHHTHEEGEGSHDAGAGHAQKRKRDEGSPSAGESAAVEGAAAELGLLEEAAGEEPLEEEVAAAETEEQGKEDKEGGEQEKKKTRLGKRALAVLSLFAGAGMMILVGLGEGD